jgi:hypothetical protein
MAERSKYDKHGAAKYNLQMPDYVRALVATQRTIVKAIGRAQLAIECGLDPLHKFSAEESLTLYKLWLSKLNAYIDEGRHDAASAVAIGLEIAESSGTPDPPSLQ